MGEELGNRRVIVANFDTLVPRRWPWQSLRNEPHLPAVVWALARPSRMSKASPEKTPCVA
jgi:hypothetical protein